MATVAASLNTFNGFADQLAEAQERIRQFTQTVRQNVRQFTQDVQQSMQLYAIGLRLNLQQLLQTVSKVWNSFETSLSGFWSKIKSIYGTMTAYLNPLNFWIGKKTSPNESQQPQPTPEQQTNLAETAKSPGTGLLGMIGAKAKKYLTLDNAGKFAKAAIGAAADNQLMKDTFIARTGSTEIGSAMFAHYQDEAIKSGENAKEYLSGVLSLLPSAKNTEQLDQLNHIAKNLAAFDKKDEGFQGAATVVQKAMGGDTKDLAERFNIKPELLASAKLGEYGKTGDTAGFIEAFNKVLEASNMGDAAANQVEESPLNKIKALKDNAGNALNTMLDSVGNVGLKAIMPLVDVLNTAFQEGKFQPFFDAVSLGLSWISEAISMVVSSAQTAWPILQQGLSMIGALAYNAGIILAGLAPIILGVAAAMGIYLLISEASAAVTGALAFVTGILTKAQAALNFVLGLNPIMRITMAIIGIITAIAAWMEMSKGIKQVFADAFGFIVDLAQGTVNAIIGFINGAIKTINTVSGFFANLLGVESKQIQEIQFKADFTKFKESGKDMIENFSLDQIKAKFHLDSLSEKKEEPVPNLPLFNQAKEYEVPVINKVNEVGKISDTVDVSSEDLKVMRDLAEIQSIQNFVTLTPTVQVTTGDISQPSDVDEIIRRIEQAMEREIANSAQGVYG